MGKGSSGGNSVSTTSGPPEAFMNAYTNVVNRAKTQSETPLQQYGGDYLAGWTPDQLAAFQNIRGSADQLQNFGTPAQSYIDEATGSVRNAQRPLWENVQQFQTPGGGGSSMENPGAEGGPLGGPQTSPNLGGPLGGPSVSPNLGGQAPHGWSDTGTAVDQYLNPYISQVVNATQNQFDVSNQRQQDDLVGSAIKAGAFGGDRASVAQAVLAGEQQRNQAPIIADLYNRGYSQALDTFQQQQQQELGADQANAWLNMQGAGALGNLGSLATNAKLGGINASLSGSNALLGIGSAQQGQNQAELNIPYQEFIQRQQYPANQIRWLSEIVGGLPSSGGSSTTQYPSPSTASQLGGLGMTGLGVVGGTGGFGANGWLTNMFSGGGGGFDMGAAMASPDWLTAGFERGGSVGHNDGGIVIPFPKRRAHGGRLPFNDNYEPQRQRATGTYAPGGIVAGPISFANFGGSDDGSKDTGKAVSPDLGHFGRSLASGLSALSSPLGLGIALGFARDGRLGTMRDVGRGIARNVRDWFSPDDGMSTQDPFGFHDPKSFSDFYGYDSEGGPATTDPGGAMGGHGGTSDGGGNSDPDGNGNWADGGVVDDTDKNPEPRKPVYRPDPNRIRKPLQSEPVVPRHPRPNKHYLDQYPPAATVFRADGGIVHRAEGGEAERDWFSTPLRHLLNPTKRREALHDRLSAQYELSKGYTPDPSMPAPGITEFDDQGGIGLPPPASLAQPADALPMPPTPRPQDGGVAAFTPSATGEELPMPPTPRPDAPTDGGVVPPPYGVNYEPPKRSGRADEVRKGAVWDALTEAGLATMAGQSPHALSNIGAGGLRGTRVLREAGERADRIEAREDERSDTGAYRRATLDQQARRMSDAADEARKRIQMQTKHHADQAEHQAATRAETERYHREQAGIQKTQAAKGFWEPVRALENEDGTPQTDENGVPVGIWKDRQTGQEKVGALADPGLRAKGAQGTTMAISKQLIADGAAADMKEALQIQRDPGGKNASSINTAQERIALQAAKADPEYQSDSKATIERWRSYYGLKGGGQVPDAAIAALRKDPSLASQFDAKYGKGSAARYLKP